MIHLKSFFTKFGVILAAFLIVAFQTQAAKTHLNMGMVLEPPHLDPTAGAAAAIDEVVYANVFEGLTRINRNGEVLPALAKSWDISKDGLKYTFQLQRGVKFHDGSAFDASDAVFSLKRAMAEGSVNAQKALFKPIATVIADGSHKVVITLKNPTGHFLFNLGWGDAVMVDQASSAGNKSKPVGTGPFIFKRWVSGDRVELGTNPNYWGSKPALKTATFKFIPDAAAAVAVIMAGDVDAFANFPAPEMADQFKNDSRFSVVEGSTEGETILSTNNQKAPFNDLRVRRAVAHALNAQEIIDGAMFGYGTPIGTHFAPHHPAYVDLKGLYPHDVEKAKKLLAEAGFPNGFEVDLYVPLGRYLGGKEATEAISGMLKKVGVTANVKTPRWGTIVKKSKARWNKGNKPFWWLGCRMDMHLHSEGMYAGQVVSWASWTGFRDKFIDKLAKDARSTIDYKTREKKYQRINRILREDKAPLVFLWQNDQIHAKKKSIKWNARPNSVVLVNEMSR